jgi:flagellar assembly factor FliW
MTESRPGIAVAEPSAPRSIDTRFGRFPVDEKSVVHFAEGLPGFEQNRRFVVLSSDELAPMHLLQAIDGPPASFLAVDPRVVLPAYRTVLAMGDRIKLAVEDDTPLLWLALVMVDPVKGPSVNLRAPIVINPARMTGCQVMPHNSLYPLRHPLEAE